jgi:hypothetical protein
VLDEWIIQNNWKSYLWKWLAVWSLLLLFCLRCSSLLISGSIIVEIILPKSRLLWLHLFSQVLYCLGFLANGDLERSSYIIIKCGISSASSRMWGVVVSMVEVVIWAVLPWPMLLARACNSQLTGVGGPSAIHVVTSFFTILLNFIGSLLNVFTWG